MNAFSRLLTQGSSFSGDEVLLRAERLEERARVVGEDVVHLPGREPGLHDVVAVAALRTRRDLDRDVGVPGVERRCDAFGQLHVRRVVVDEERERDVPAAGPAAPSAAVGLSQPAARGEREAPCECGSERADPSPWPTERHLDPPRRGLPARCVRAAHRAPVRDETFQSSRMARTVDAAPRRVNIRPARASSRQHAGAQPLAQRVGAVGEAGRGERVDERAARARRATPRAAPRRAASPRTSSSSSAAATTCRHAASSSRMSRTVGFAGRGAVRRPAVGHAPGVGAVAHLDRLCLPRDVDDRGRAHRHDDAQRRARRPERSHATAASPYGVRVARRRRRQLVRRLRLDDHPCGSPAPPGASPATVRCSQSATAPERVVVERGHLARVDPCRRAACCPSAPRPSSRPSSPGTATTGSRSAAAAGRRSSAWPADVSASAISGVPTKPVPMRKPAARTRSASRSPARRRWSLGRQQRPLAARARTRSGQSLRTRPPPVTYSRANAPRTSAASRA